MFSLTQKAFYKKLDDLFQTEGKKLNVELYQLRISTEFSLSMQTLVTDLR